MEQNQLPNLMTEKLKEKINLYKWEKECEEKRKKLLKECDPDGTFERVLQKASYGEQDFVCKVIKMAASEGITNGQLLNIFRYMEEIMEEMKQDSFLNSCVKFKPVEDIRKAIDRKANMLARVLSTRKNMREMDADALNLLVEINALRQEIQSFDEGEEDKNEKE